MDRELARGVMKCWGVCTDVNFKQVSVFLISFSFKGLPHNGCTPHC